MRLIYYRGTTPNFGDDLNAHLWPALAPGLFNEQHEAGFLGIGTILGMNLPPVRKLNVFSSGVGYREIDLGAQPYEFWCVRGPLSAKVLGQDPKVSLTDGAILSPLVMTEAEGGPGHIGVVPHWESLLCGGWEEACRLSGFNLINPTGSPEEVISQIRRQKLILAESLHGAIIADTYGIPWIAFATSGNFSIFKWTDWSLSLQQSFELTCLPPPAAEASAKYGAPKFAGWGDRYRPTIEDAFAEFKQKSREMKELIAKYHQSVAAGKDAMPVTIVERAKKKLKASALYRSMKRLSPERTAEALVALSKSPPNLSSEQIRRGLQDEMQTRFRKLEAQER